MRPVLGDAGRGRETYSQIQCSVAGNIAILSRNIDLADCSSKLQPMRTNCNFYVTVLNRQLQKFIIIIIMIS
jgi:hypothetical protein